MSGIVASAVGIVLALASFAVLVPALVFAAEVMAALGARGADACTQRASGSSVVGEDDAGGDFGEAGRVAVLIPAHDEADGIARTLRALAPRLRASDRLLVVADNCSDATAAVARGEGAEVVERSDAARRGKGYALDAGVRHLEHDPPDVVVFVDADCLVGPGALATIARACRASDRPVQALYLMQAAADAPLRQRFAGFAWLVRNLVRPLGAARLGAPCQLMGTGMALPWRLARDATLASGNIVEDMQLGLDLAAAGHAPLFCPRAVVTSEFPRDAGAALAQRTRWEHGHVSTIVTNVPRLLLRALARADARLAAMALDLLVPPVASLVLATTGLVVLDAFAWRLGTSSIALWLAGAALLLVGAAALCAWSRFARHLVRGSELLALPLYVLAKVPVYARLVTRRQSEWVRTRRDAGRR